MDQSTTNTSGSSASSPQRTALVVAHPGHELMVHGWLELTRPLVFVLTDGSGHSNQSRLSSTDRILSQACAQRGSIYGRLTDTAGYAAILDHDFDLFIGLAMELSEAFVNQRVDLVVGDALEGYNPMHDGCRLLINAAVTIARAHGREIANFEFSPISQPDSGDAPLAADEIVLRLDEQAFGRKISAAQGYRELAGEVLDAFGRTAVEAFAVERLRPADPNAGTRAGDEPFYEQYGEQQVTAGHYTRVLRYREHFAPLSEALRKYAENLTS